MKIRVAILDNDVNYLSRISDVFHTKYAERIELYSFTDCETAVEALASTRIHVFLASDLFDVECARLPEKCGFAYFVESGGIEMIRGRKAVCKFQKADVIYQQILSIYSDCSEGISGTGFRETDGKRIAFLSPVGGSGSSTMAAACALHFARQGKKVFYLNLEKFGSADLFFPGTEVLI